MGHLVHLGNDLYFIKYLFVICCYIIIGFLIIVIIKKSKLSERKCSQLVPVFPINWTVVQISLKRIYYVGLLQIIPHITKSVQWKWHRGVNQLTVWLNIEFVLYDISIELFKYKNINNFLESTFIFTFTSHWTMLY